MNREKFSPLEHLPKYTKHVYWSLRAPLVMYFVLIGNFFMLLLITAFHFFERGVNPNIHNFLDSFWWGLTTVTTVGYGDIVPVTVLGKVTAIFLMVVGVVFFVGFTALFISYLLSKTHEPVENAQFKEILELKAQLDRIEKKLDRGTD